MRNIHPAAVAGLLLNFALVWMSMTALSGLDLSLLEPQDREFVAAIIDATHALRPIYYALLFTQALALGLIAMRIKAGIILAAFAAFLMLPHSLVYFMGCVLSHYRNKYADFTVVPAGAYDGAFFVFRSAWAKKMRIATGVSMALSVVSVFLGRFDFSLILFGLALGGFYCTIRAGKNHALALRDTAMVLTPELFAPRLLIPYTQVRQATLLGTERIIMEVETPSGLKRFAWLLRSLEPAERLAAIEELGAALAAHNVPLQ